MTLQSSDIEIEIQTEWCKGCGICVAFCPKNVLVMNPNLKVEIIDREKCIRCGLCELRCPDFAIFLGVGDHG